MSALRSPLARGLAVVVALLPLLGCNAVVHGRSLSHRSRPERIYLSTGGSPRPFRTLGFIQVSGEGQTYAGMVDVGAAAFDTVVVGSLSQEAEKMGGDGVIHIEFLDENPPTAYERATDAAQSFTYVNGSGQSVQSRRRNVVATGEVIQFIRNP